MKNTTNESLSLFSKNIFMSMKEEEEGEGKRKEKERKERGRHTQYFGEKKDEKREKIRQE